MTSVDDLLARRRPHEVAVKVSLRNDLSTVLARLHHDLTLAEETDRTENRLPEAQAIRAQIADVTRQMSEDVVECRFRELGRAAYEQLVREHPPRGQDVDEDADWNTETFPAALIAASCVDPAMTPGDGKRLWDELPFGEARALFAAAVTAQAKVGAVPLPSPGTGGTVDTGTNSTTAPPEESPTPSS